MRTRHKPPTLVSMWMLDVFCCALGCVTLLWLLNTRQLDDQTKRAGSALEVLARTEADLDATRRRLTAEADDLRGKLAATTAERDTAAKHLARTDADLADARAKLAASDARADDLGARLARQRTDAADLSAKLAASAQAADDLARLVRRKDQERDELARKAKAADDQVHDLDARLRSAAKEAKDAADRLAALRRTGDELASARADAQTARRKMDEAAATIIDLQGQKAKLADKYDKLQRDADNRFAGIALTGTRVVFAVDMSGSMKLLDDKTPAPGKWPTVVETVGKVMRSLPGLEKFQVVVFSRKARYLLGDGGWLSYDGESSVRRVTAALSAVDPSGDTNLFDALDLAFRLKPGGLDTVYLFSDGLPTSGPGLTAQQEALKDAERTELLSRHVRRTLTAEWNRAGGGKRVRVNAVGFFFESPEVGAFLWALARDNDGSFVGMSRP